MDVGQQFKHIDPNYARVTGLVPVSALLKYREYDREGADALEEHSPDRIAGLTDVMRSGELREPLMMMYSTANHRAVLGEGNHRLAAAVRAGVTHLPVRVITGRLPLYKGEDMTLDTSSPHASGVKPDYTPDDMHPHAFKELR